MSASQEPFWRLPRRLGQEVDEGRLALREFALLSYLGAHGLGHHGALVTLGGLAATLGYSTKWISATLRVLRDEKHYIEYVLRPGERHAFRVTEGAALRALTSEVTSEVTSVPEFRGDLPSDLGSGGSREDDQTQAASELAPSATSEVTSEVGEVPEKRDERQELNPDSSLRSESASGLTPLGALEVPTTPTNAPSPDALDVTSEVDPARGGDFGFDVIGDLVEIERARLARERAA